MKCPRDRVHTNATFPRTTIVAVTALLVTACGDNRAAPLQPHGWDDDLRLPVAVDRNPDPTVVEVDLDAAPTKMSFVPGGPTEVWAYNGLLPGPLIRARVGDRLIVHVSNHLTEDTTVHWHGVRVPFEMDGVPDVSQPGIAPGETFDYDFVVPDASLFWYHPHFDSAAQVGFGLYGALLVDDPAEPPGLGDEVVMVLSDIGVLEDGTILPKDAGGDLATLFGREGNILLVNGKIRPTLKARPGARQRWRVVNASKTRYFQLSLAGHTFTRIGGDGGLMAAPMAVAEPVLAPAERADFLVVPNGEPGTDLVVKWLPYNRGFGATLVPIQDLMVIHLEGEPVATAELPELHRDIPPIDVSGATPVTVELTDVHGNAFKLGLNGIPFDESEPFEAKVGRRRYGA